MDILLSSRRGWWRRLAAVCLGLVGMQGIGNRKSGFGSEEALAHDRPACGPKKTPASWDRLEDRQPVSDRLSSGMECRSITTFTYDASSRLSSLKDRVATVTTFVYDIGG